MDTAFLLPEEPPLAGVSDFRGRPVYRSSSGGWRSAFFLIVMEVAETLAYFGVSANLITYLTGPLGQSNASSSAAVNVWSGTASLMPLLGAFVADYWLGRYRSIILACTLYVLGYGMITLASTLPTSSSANENSISHPWSLQVAFFYTSLYLIALAQGPDMPCGLAFAADQFDSDHPKECAARSSLFNWWYFFVAIGTTVAVATFGYIQENLGWVIGFGALFFLVLCAFTVFLLGTPTYRFHAATLGDTVDKPKLEEAHSLLRLLPIWVACLAYGVVLAQVSTVFTKQGETLDCRILGGLELQPATLQTFGSLAGMLFLPIYDRLLVPALGCVTGNPSGLTPLQRVGTGLALSLTTMLLAALVEAQRLEVAREHGLVDDADATVPMSWAWLVPQYVMIGVADLFVTVGLQEFFYDQMPTELRSLALALYFGVIGVGSFISGALVSLVDTVTSSGGGDSWFADNLNRAHLDYFYWLLAGLSAVELTLYLFFTNSYVYRRTTTTASFGSESASFNL